MERRTSWSPVRGAVHNTFDDLLVRASNSLPAKYMDRLEPWGLSDLVPFQSQYMSGFRSESYQIGIEEGFDEARKQMRRPIRDSIRRDIGGDEQRIHSTRSEFDNITSSTSCCRYGSARAGTGTGRSASWSTLAPEKCKVNAPGAG